MDSEESSKAIGELITLAIFGYIKNNYDSEGVVKEGFKDSHAAGYVLSLAAKAGLLSEYKD